MFEKHLSITGNLIQTRVSSRSVLEWKKEEEVISVWYHLIPLSEGLSTQLPPREAVFVRYLQTQLLSPPQPPSLSLSPSLRGWVYTCVCLSVADWPDSKRYRFPCRKYSATWHVISEATPTAVLVTALPHRVLVLPHRLPQVYKWTWRSSWPWSKHRIII